MYVKTLALRGFKSFASATSLRFEPGITCVVGPNGSGKSNVVDAFSWVMGEQGAKSLRGGKMEDVVFAGTSGRPALGRAEVSLTIDNSDGALPIDYAEVTISRLLFRSGQSEYSINGDHCRLLDVQELLSDSGLGREMHVIVGQGQLDEVINAGPETRRALIEEAAGVLKHRRRKEKALRKLDAMQANLTRLVDLTGELGRRLKPLGRQAQIARKAAVIQADLRDARLRLLADDYGTLLAELERDEADEVAKAQAKATLEAALGQARQRESDLEAAELLHAPRLAAAQETFFALSGLAERLRGTASLAAERHRNLTAPEPHRPGRDADELDAEAEVLREQEDDLGDRLAEAREQLAAAVAQRSRAEDRVAETERRQAADARAAAQRAERLARLRAQAEAATGKAAAAQGEAGRLAEAFAQATERAEAAQADYARLREQVSGTEDGRDELIAAREQAAARLKQASASVARLRQAERDAGGELAGLRARADALAEAVTSGADASAVLLAQPSAFDGVLGPLATLLTVADGAQEAIAAALGAAAGAVAVDGLDAAVAILASLRTTGAGRAGLVIAGGSPSAASGEPALPASLPPSAVPARELVQAPAQLTAAVDDLLAGVIVTDDLAAGLELLRHQPGLRLVTRDGDLLGTHWARGGSAGGQSLLSLKAAASEASAQLAASHERSQYAEGQLAVAIEDEEQARQDLAEAQAALQQVDAAAAQTSGKLGTLSGAAKAAHGEASRLSAAIEVAQRSEQQSRASAAELQARLAEQEAQDAAADADDPAADGEPGEPAPTRQELDAAATAARAAEMEARLEVRTVEERLRAISGRADARAAAAVAEREATARAHARRELRTSAAAVARAVAEGARFALARIQASAAAADTERQHAEQASKGRDGELKAVRAGIRDLTAELDKVVNSAHGVQMAHATRRMQLEQIAGRVAEEFAVEVPELLADYGPAIPIPPAEEGQLAIPYERAAQEKRAQTAQRMLDQLGKVNPLALEEFAALEERHAFLVAQLEDLRKTRRDLLTVIKEVDDRVLQVFTSAYADTAREFERIFGTLFPGGDGRLILTEPDDMLATGIDFEARPPGKKVKRLSLLSGGERSLTAIAFLVAIFMARPSPFYVLDEVEAALDDTNLGRLLEIFAELRQSSQLIIITHQKRTMEIADSLYGISMRGDGVSNVVSQRLRERETA
ncbi:MAG TPA: chromosome segregation protein SMC [Streptosporangiaceae bacterium]|nr:chromosome segregation protein SMC [Streptosporangiaceae bacterium]